MNAISKTSSMSRLSAWIDPHPSLDGIALIDHLFNRLDGLYPHRWRSAFSSPQAIANWRETWADGFVAEGMTIDDIKVGIRACRTRFEWPPSFAEFIAACRPHLEPETAFCEAIRQLRMREFGRDQWSHPAIFWAAMALGQFEMTSTTWASIRNRWTDALLDELAKREWPQIPKMIPELPREAVERADPEEVKRRFAEIRRKWEASNESA